MPRRLSAFFRALVCTALCAAALPAFALEPLTVDSEGVIAAGGATAPPPRDAAFRVALVAAVVEPRAAAAARALAATPAPARALEPQAQTCVDVSRTGSLRSARRRSIRGVQSGRCRSPRSRHAGAADLARADFDPRGRRAPSR